MKKLIVLSTLLLMSITIMGQSISKQINDIKRSSKYLSAEATLETESRAYELANELLSRQITEYIQEKGSLQKANTVVIKNVAGKAEKLQMKRGTMSRVFLYVEKKDIVAVDNIRVVDNKTQKTTDKETGEETIGSLASNVEVIDSIDTKSVSDDKDLYASVSYPNWQQEVIYTIMGSTSIKEAQYLLDRFRVGLKIKRYGAMENCKNPEKCYWAIFDENEHVITVLGPGNEERINFSTQEKDSLKNYSGKGAIWFTLSN